MVALTAVALGFAIYPLTEPGHDVIDSDWPAFATGAKLAISDPAHLYDLDVQRAVQLQVTGGAQLVTPGIKRILPFLAPAYVALIAVPFEALGTELGGRLWVLFGLACLALGMWLAARPRAASAALPGFASVPTALLLLNAQLDGFVALGLGAALALWSRPFLAGLALGLTLTKPQLVLPAGLALILARRWRLLAGWAVAGVALWASFAILDPRWVMRWLGPASSTVQPIAREVDLAHLAVFLPQGAQTYGLAAISLVTGLTVIWLAWRRRDDTATAASILVAGGILASPHALPADLVLVSLALVMWPRADAWDWVILSAGAVVAALAPAPMPVVVGLVVIARLLLRQSLLPAPLQPAPLPASSR
jgi:glycosyl transferase family 87